LDDEGTPTCGDPSQARLEGWLLGGTAGVVKDGPHRTVYRLDTDQGRYFLKHCRCRGWVQALGHLIRSSPARREFTRSREIARRGVPTVTALAYGEQRRWGLVRDSYLVTTAIPDTVALDDFLARRLPRLPDENRSIAKRRIVVSLAQFCAAAHKAGVFHHDFHAGNLLIRTDSERTGDEAELFLIDVPHVRLTGPMNWRASRASLVMLCTSLEPLASLSDFWRFWRAYRRARSDLDVGQPRDAAAQIALRSRQAARRILRGRDRRAMRNNREFQRLPTRAGVAYAVRGVGRETLHQLLADPEMPVRQFRHAPVKLGHGSLVVRARITLDGRPVNVAFKQARRRGFWKTLTDRLRGRRLFRSWKNGHALLSRGIATPRPLAVWLPDRRMVRRDCYSATEWIEGAEDFHLYLWRIAALPPDERRRRVRQLAERLGSLIGRMHNWGVSHGDLKGCNLLIVERGRDVQAYVLDLDSVRIRRRLTRRAQVRDLARLAASLAAHAWVGRSAAMAFMKSYQTERHAGWRDSKPLWRQAARRAARKVQQQRRAGKPVA